MFEVKSSSRPGVVAAAADQLRHQDDEGSVKVLIVPFMTPAGAQVPRSAPLTGLISPKMLICEPKTGYMYT